MIYAASSAALAMLEYLSIKGPIVSKNNWFMVVYEIADISLIAELDKNSLPQHWDAIPHGKLTQDFGKAWLREEAQPFLRVPSVRVSLSRYPEEHNLLINPEFPKIKSLLKKVEAKPFQFVLGKRKRV